MDSKLILVVIGMIAMTFGRSEAITCYQCSSSTNSRCSDPFNSTGITTCQSEICYKVWDVSRGATVVARDCSRTTVRRDECGDILLSGARTKGCICRTDYCNDGQLVKPTLYNVFLAMATITAIAWMNQI